MPVQQAGFNCPQCKTVVQSKEANCFNCGYIFPQTEDNQSQKSGLDLRDRYQNLTQNQKYLVWFVGAILGFALISQEAGDSKSKSNANNDPIQNIAMPPDTAKVTPQPTTERTNFDDPEIKSRVEKGGQVYKGIEARYKLPISFGWQAADMSLLIPHQEWNKLTKEDQVNLSYYAQNLVQAIRKNPKSYVDRWTAYYKAGGQVERGYEYDGLSQSTYLAKVSRLCGSCWDIKVGKVSSNGEFDEQDTPVKGSSAEQFRQVAEKQNVKTDKEKEAEEFQKFAASMSPSEHLSEAKKALADGYTPNEERFGNTILARDHIKAIPPSAPEYKEAQDFLKEIIKRERERKEFQDAVIREVKRMTGVK